MDREEILKQAQSKLPDANQWGMPIVAIHIIKDLPLVVNDEIILRLNVTKYGLCGMNNELLNINECSFS